MNCIDICVQTGQHDSNTSDALRLRHVVFQVRVRRRPRETRLAWHLSQSCEINLAVAKWPATTTNVLTEKASLAAARTCTFLPPSVRAFQRCTNTSPMPRPLHGCRRAPIVGQLAERDGLCRPRGNANHRLSLVENGGRSPQKREIAGQSGMACLANHAYVRIRTPRIRRHRTREVQTIVRLTELRMTDTRKNAEAPTPRLVSAPS